MGIDVTVGIEIEAAPAKVFAYLANPNTEPEWISGITASHVLTNQPTDIGTQVRHTASFMGRMMEYVTEITSFEDGHLLKMETVSGPFSMIISYSVSETDSGCQVHLRNQGGPSGLMSLMAPLMARMVHKNTSKDLAQLKAILESQT